jgi:hypothetical protein
MSGLLEEDEVINFVREYDHCAECQGWDERFVGIQRPKRNFYGQLLEQDHQPSGIRLRGRSNHRRICSKRQSQ